VETLIDVLVLGYIRVLERREMFARMAEWDELSL
jgi:hypothetical protein